MEYGGIDTTSLHFSDTFSKVELCGVDTTLLHILHMFCPKSGQKWCPLHLIPLLRVQPGNPDFRRTRTEMGTVKDALKVGIKI